MLLHTVDSSTGGDHDCESLGDLMRKIKVLLFNVSIQNKSPKYSNENMGVQYTIIVEGK